MKLVAVFLSAMAFAACRMFSTDPLTPEEVGPFCHQYTRGGTWSGTWSEEDDCRRRELAALDAGDAR